MNNIIAITACLKRCSIAIKYNNKTYEFNENIDAPTYLASSLDSLLKQNNINLKYIEKFVTISGPGSFTGIRTAQSLVKGLSLATNIPAKCISYFDVIKNICKLDKFVAVIQTDKHQLYFKDFYTENIGVSPLNELLEKFRNPIEIAGEIDSHLIKNTNHKIIEIKDFRNAKYLLGISDISENIKPLYINSGI